MQVWKMRKKQITRVVNVGLVNFSRQHYSSLAFSLASFRHVQHVWSNSPPILRFFCAMAIGHLKAYSGISVGQPVVAFWALKIFSILLPKTSKFTLQLTERAVDSISHICWSHL